MQHNSHSHNARPWWLPIVIVGGALLLIPITLLMAFLYQQWLELDAAMPQFTMTLRVLFFAVPFALISAGVIYVGVIGWKWLGIGSSIEKLIRVMQTMAEKRQGARAKTLHYEVNSESTTGEPQALPAPIDVVKPMSEWMAWALEQPHILLGGKTRAGKTHTASALLARRIDAGCDVFIIDPHSSDWMGLPTAGGSGADERTAALKAIYDAYNYRMAIRDEHKRKTGHELPQDYFDPLIVLIDEANAMLEEQGNQWRGTIKAIASGSRKVGISLIALAQSPLVEDLGLSGGMRENFSRIALDDRTVQKMIDDERDRDRKAALQAAFKTMDRPAAAQIGAQTWLLDRRGMSPGQASADTQVWAGWDFTRGRVVSIVSPNAIADDGNESSIPVTRPGAESSNSSIVPSAAEIATIAERLGNGTPSQVAKSLDGYHPRKHDKFKAKVDYVVDLLRGGTR